MAERVYLHVGAPKSGTSYLQEVLWANRDKLLVDGVLLPESRQLHYAAMCDLRRGQWADPATEGAFDKLVDLVRLHPGTAIISEEMLGAATTEQAVFAVQRFEPAEVHVVVAVRDLARSIPSAWQQSVRARGVTGFGTFVETLRRGGNRGFWETQFPVPVLRRWTTLLPPERRHVVVVPREGSPRELLWQRFAEAVGLDPHSYDVGSPVGNPSLGAAEAELLRRVNVALGGEFPLNMPYGKVVRAHLTVPVLLRNTSPVRIVLPPESSGWVRERSGMLIEELRDFPCHVVGELADLEPADPARVTTSSSPPKSPDDYPVDELLDLALDTMVGMLRHTDERIGSWRRTLAASQEGARDLQRRLRKLKRQRREQQRSWWEVARRGARRVKPGMEP